MEWAFPVHGQKFFLFIPACKPCDYREISGKRAISGREVIKAINIKKL